jgi:hypothetical protein
MNAFCASVNFDAFTAFHSSQPGKSGQKTPTQNDPIFREQSNQLWVVLSLNRAG